MKRVFIFIITCGCATATLGQDYSKYSEEALRAELARTASAELLVPVPMRDHVSLSTDIYRPKDAERHLPTILWRTPYNEHKLYPLPLRYAVEAVNRGYAFIVQNERGRYFSEGKFELLGYPQTDGYDALTWIAARPWSNGKVGTLGCSSTAEWQLALAAQKHPAHAAMVPMAAGAGIGKVGRFQEQGNWYRGGVPRTLFFPWLYGMDNPLRAQIPSGLDPSVRAHIAEYNDLDAKKPKVDWIQHIRHLPVETLLSDLGEPPATFDAFIRRTPDDPAWRQGGLYHDDMAWGVPSLWINSWYDISIGPNLELFNHVRMLGADGGVRTQQYVVILPTPHCTYDLLTGPYKLGPDATVGDRSLGDTSFDLNGAIFSWFDRWLKGDSKAFSDSTAHVRYFTMGENRWKADSQWPPQHAKILRLYLRSKGRANSLYGDGMLSFQGPPAAEASDRYTYDPMNPVQTIGGGDCCNSGMVTPGAYDQRIIETRDDVLVYTSDPLNKALEISGFIDVVLKVSSDAKDTDFAVKLVDVTPDGTAFILDDTILRARYRNGYDRPTMMQPGTIYTLKPTPMTTSNRFEKGHRIRIEITSSNFPKFVRNLNTGGRNESESFGVTARNELHHDGRHPSYIELPIVE